MQCYLKQVYPDLGKEADANIDVVFVHGLNPRGSADHAQRTWTHANGTFWPQALMPHIVPSSRVLLFGYNSSVTADISGSTFRHHSIQLLDRLLSMRTDPIACARPIIFICHSLGGLVVKQALILAQLSTPRYGIIRSSTKGLVFFATPHGGGKGAGLATPIANAFSLLTGQPRNDLLKMLRKDSLFTKELTENFNPQKDDYEVRTFFETEFTEVRLRSWRIFPQITSMLVVDEQSATYGSSIEAYPIPILDNHSGICKFSGLTDPKFATVQLHLEQLVTAVLRSGGSIRRHSRASPTAPATAPAAMEVLTAPKPPQVLPLAVRTHPDIPSRKDARPVTQTVNKPEATQSHGKKLEELQVPREKTGDRPINLTPRIHTSNFLGRDSLFEDMEKYFDTSQTPGRKAALWGMAGVGKTQFALEFCRRRHQKFGVSVFWIDSQSTESLQNGFHHIAEELGLGMADFPLSVRRWFRNNPGSLIVFDNVVDLRDVQPFILSDAVDTLITTRDSAIVGSEMIPFGMPVPLLHEIDAATLFVLSLGPWEPATRTNIQDDLSGIFSPSETTGQTLSHRFGLTSVAEVHTVIGLIDRLPLAIVQCASYLRQHPMPFDQYLEKFKAAAPDTLRRFYGHRTKGTAYHESVMTTWDMSIARLSVNAVRMVTLFGFLGRSHISMPFLQHALDNSTFWGGECSIRLPESVKRFFAFLDLRDDFYDSLGALLSLSLVTQDAENRQIFVHPMIHEYIHLRLPPNEAAEWIVNVIALLSHQLPPLSYSSGQDTDAPNKAEQGFAHLERAASLTELYFESIRLVEYSAPSLLFLEAYLWYRGARYLRLAEVLVTTNSATSEPFGGVLGHPWDLEMLYGARLLWIISDFHANPGQGLDTASFDSLVTRIRSLPAPDDRRSERPKETLLQATISHRWIDALIPSNAAGIAKDLRVALAKFPHFSWQSQSALPQGANNIDLVCSAIFSHCRAKATLALTLADANRESAAAELMFTHREGGLLGLSYGCSELANFFSDLLDFQMGAAAKSCQDKDVVKLLDLLSFYSSTSSLHSYLDRQWHAVESTLSTFAANSKTRSSAVQLLRQEYFNDRSLTSPILRQLFFQSSSQEEEWLRQRISMQETQLTTDKGQVSLRRYKARLAELITQSGPERSTEAHRLLEEVFDRRLDQAEVPSKGLSRYGHNVLEPVQDISALNARRDFFRQVAAVLMSLGSKDADKLVRRWAWDLYRVLERQSPNTVLPDMCDILIPWWDNETYRSTHTSYAEIDLLDRWGLFIIGLPGSTDMSPTTILRGYRLCTRINRTTQLHSSVSTKRAQFWAAKADDYDSIFGRFGSWEHRAITDRDIMELTLTGVRLQRSGQESDEIKSEMIRRKFDRKEIERSFATPLPSATGLPIVHTPTFVALPLGRAIGTATKVVAACYHGPRLGLWITREAQSERSILFWTRVEKAGVFYVDIRSTMTLNRFYKSYLLLELGPAPADGYCVFQLHYWAYGDWRYAANGKHVLDQFEGCGGSSKEVAPPSSVGPKGNCHYYPDFEQFLEASDEEGDLDN